MTSDDSGSTDELGREDPLWDDLLEDARAIAEEYREDGWDAVVLEPVGTSPVEEAERTGLDVDVTAEEYELVAELIEDGDVTISAADVYYRPLAAEESDQRVALVVERDEESETAVFVPLSYDIGDCRSVFETALVEEQLLIHVTADPEDGWVSFSHDDPSLFLEEADVRQWSAE
ncbi:hypothetical protein [Natrinema sp. DC36]|uniref:DUF7529 family protein n=1 Tax=Natrinema sp. DC36 TaxID=2878680 RepID=UPI001CF01951|nr:hypothetical protein [Natrinema sp. DC36]